MSVKPMMKRLLWAGVCMCLPLAGYAAEQTGQNTSATPNAAAGQAAPADATHSPQLDAKAAPSKPGKHGEHGKTGHILPGKWTTTIHMIMPGMPFTPAPRTFSNCVSDADANLSIKDMVGDLLGPDCTLDDFSTSNTSAGKQAHWETSCTGKHAKKGTGTLTLLSNKHYKLASKVMLLDVGGTMQIDSEAKWQGSCQKSDG